MKVQRLAQMAVALFLAGSGTSFAQCVTKEMNQDFAYMAKAGVGPVCVNDTPQSKKVCISAGKIASYKYDIVDEKNMVGKTEVKQLDDQCLEAMTTGHAKEVGRTQNGWLCSAAERTIAIHISYCQ